MRRFNSKHERLLKDIETDGNFATGICNLWAILTELNPKHTLLKAPGMKKLKETAAATIDPATVVTRINGETAERESAIERSLAFFSGGGTGLATALLNLCDKEFPGNGPGVFIALMSQIAELVSATADMSAIFANWPDSISSFIEANKVMLTRLKHGAQGFNDEVSAELQQHVPRL